MNRGIKRILVADDEISIRLLLSEELKEGGYEVYQATNGLEACEIFDIIPIDLVILDLKMPEMDGIEALGKMKERKSDIPVIIFTGYGEYINDFATWVADDYLVKTSHLGELFERITYHLKKNH